MSTFDACIANGYSPINRRDISDEERSALDFLYHAVPISSATVTGTTDLFLNEYGFWSVVTSGGNPHLNYIWEIKFDGGNYLQSTKKVSPMLPISDSWVRTG